MRIYNRTNIPEKTAKEAVSLIIKGRKGHDIERTSVDKLHENVYRVSIFGYPPLQVEIMKDDDVMIMLLEENN